MYTDAYDLKNKAVVKLLLFVLLFAANSLITMKTAKIPGQGCNIQDGIINIFAIIWNNLGNYSTILIMY